jgi:hypothetical protein
MESSGVLQKILKGRPEGKRSIGRPRLRQLDDVNDLRNMGVRQQRKKAEDRREWTGIVREAEVKLKRTVQPKKKKKKKETITRLTGFKFFLPSYLVSYLSINISSNFLSSLFSLFRSTRN